ARGEAAGAAASPGYKIQYLVGKWQIEQLLGRVRDREGASFSLHRFNDHLLSYGSIPLSIIQRLMLGEERPPAHQAGRTSGTNLLHLLARKNLQLTCVVRERGLMGDRKQLWCYTPR